MAFKFVYDQKIDLASLPCFKGVTFQHQQLEQVYYDTPTLALRQNKQQLVVTDQSQRYIQCLWIQEKKKAVPQEYLAQVSSKTIDYTKLYTTPMAKQLTNDDFRASIESLFTLEIQQLEARLGQDSAEYHVTARHGMATIGTQKMPFTELSVTLIQGQEAAFMDFVISLQQSTNAKMQFESIEATCFSLIQLQWAKTKKPSSLKLRPSMSTEMALQTILRRCLQDVRVNELATLQGRDIEGVHQMRVSFRRFRACLSVFKKVIGKQSAKRIEREIKWLGKSLGPARDFDVFLEGVATLQGQMPGNPYLTELAAHIKDLRDNAYDRLHENLYSDRYAQLVVQLNAWVAAKGWRQNLTQKQEKSLAKPVQMFARRVLSKELSKLLSKGQHFRNLEDETRHALRIEVKKVRYAAHFFSDLFPGESVKPQLSLMGRNQEVLGEMQDVVMAEQLLESAGYEEDHPVRHIFAGWYACVNQGNRDRSIEAWQQWHAMPPFWV